MRNHPFDFNPWETFQTQGEEEAAARPAKPWQATLNWCLLALLVSLLGMLVVPFILLFYSGSGKATSDLFEKPSPGEVLGRQCAIMLRLALIPLFWLIGWGLGTRLTVPLGLWPGVLIGIVLMNLGVNIVLVLIDGDLRRQARIDELRHEERKKKLDEAREAMFGKRSL
jgi:hypothetical protein